MKNKLSNPLWTHLPAIAMFVTVIVYTITAVPLPSQVPIHFGFNGIPNDYGSPWVVFGIVVGLSVLFLATAFIIDEAWARSEKKKTFNWLCLFDELTLGTLGGIYIGYVHYLKSGDSTFGFPWQIFTITTITTLALAALLELWRPFPARARNIAFGDTARLEKELAAKIIDDAAIIYWQSQNPLWVTLLSVVLPIVMVIAAVFLWFVTWWAAIIVAVAALTMVAPYGGMQTSVNKEAVTVSFGLLGSKVLKLKTTEIAAVELREFSPMNDFGGYGIRFNGKIWAYYMHGTRGVLFTTLNGKQYLIGSDNPEELYAVAQAVVKG